MDVPKIRNALLITKWIEYFTNFLHRTVGKRNIMLYYVIRESDTVPSVALLMARIKSYSEEHGSVEKYIIKRSPHTHPHFKEDKSNMHYYIEYTTRTMRYSEPIKT